MSEVEQLKSRIAELELLLWLAAEDVVFFSHYNEDIKDWDRGFYAAVLCNDTFYYATADAEGIAPGQAPEVRDFYERYGWSGVAAWVSKQRGAEALKELQDDQYRAALAELNAAGYPGITPAEEGDAA